MNGDVLRIIYPKQAGITVPTVSGSISVAYARGGDFSLSLTVPQGTTARVVLPTGHDQTVFLNGKAVDKEKLSARGKGAYLIMAR